MSHAMQVRFTKGKDKPDTLHCIRADGSQTWTRLPHGFGPLHDLAHYVVETTLGFDRAFYGLLAQGRAIEEFADTEDRSWVGEQGLQAETIVMTLQYETAGSAAPEAFFEMVEQACRGLGIATPATLTSEAVAVMRARYRRLLRQWAQTPLGGDLELIFPEPAHRAEQEIGVGK
jgi:hypothetical protein